MPNTPNRIRTADSFEHWDSISGPEAAAQIIASLNIPSKLKVKLDKVSSTANVATVWGKIPPEELRKGGAKFTLDSPFPYKNYVGLEIEVEGFNRNSLVDLNTGDYFPVARKILDGFLAKEDGSLRAGTEFSTHVGIQAGEALGYLVLLDQLLKDHGSTFSFRCGLHVHLNVCSHTLEDLYKVCLIYAVIEDLLFEMSGNRRANKFCVAVRDSNTIVPDVIHYGHTKNWVALQESISRGTKYMAMNLLPIRTFGSIEFRHHYGTSDPDTISRWLLVLSDLVEGARQLNIEELERRLLDVNTSSEYPHFLEYLLPNSFQFFTKLDLHKMMYKGVAFAKQSLLPVVQQVTRKGMI